MPRRTCPPLALQQPLEDGVSRRSLPKLPQPSVSTRRTLLIRGDIVAALLSVAIALALWAHRADEPLTIDFIVAHLIWFCILPLLWFILARVNEYYNLRVTANLTSSLARLTLITLELVVIYLATFFLAPRGLLPRRFFVYYAVISLVLIGLWRAARLLLASWTGFRRRALIVGTGGPAQIIMRAIKEEAARDYEIIGYITSANDPPAPVESVGEVLGTGSDLFQIVKERGIAELIVAYVNEIPGDVFQGLMECYGSGIEIVPMSALYEEITGRIPIELVGEHLWALVLPLGEHTSFFNIYLALKRLMDIVSSIIGLLCFAPFFPFVALAIKLDSPGPVFYSQDRVGRGGKNFRIIKFRSMIDNAEALTGPRWAAAYDERVTRLGRFLRKTRIDEVPQLINVFLGQMSLVGPRPERPEFVQILGNNIPFYRARLVVKPGLTGWAQVRYRYGNSLQDALLKLQYDLYYIRHQSLLLDLIIAIKTIGTMLRFQGT